MAQDWKMAGKWVPGDPQLPQLLCLTWPTWLNILLFLPFVEHILSTAEKSRDLYRYKKWGLDGISSMRPCCSKMYKYIIKQKLPTSYLLKIKMKTLFCDFLLASLKCLELVINRGRLHIWNTGGISGIFPHGNSSAAVLLSHSIAMPSWR